MINNQEMSFNDLPLSKRYNMILKSNMKLLDTLKILEEENEKLNEKVKEQRNYILKHIVNTTDIIEEASAEDITKDNIIILKQKTIDRLEEKIKNQGKQLNTLSNILRQSKAIDYNKTIKEWKGKYRLRSRLEDEFFKDRPDLRQEWIQLNKDNPYITEDELLEESL